MFRYVLKRLGQTALTVLGVLAITFVLFKGVSGDAASAYLGDGAGESQKAQWRHNHGYDLPAARQFLNHVRDCATFSGRSLRDNKTIADIFAQRGKYSLSLMLPAMALEWFLGLSLACLVAYYRGRWIDKFGVLLSVLGMCVPLLGMLIFAQWLMFRVGDGRYAFGLSQVGNIYVPIVVIAACGVGGKVRFYRTIILEQLSCDYVRTAVAKGVHPAGVMFWHVLPNVMPAILTGISSAIPFLILGSLLAESMFGIPGLGDLMVSSIANRDEPIMTALVFVTSLAYCLTILATDIACAALDPRIRLGK